MSEKIKVEMPEQFDACVIIEAPTGVIYVAQVGGTACGRAEVEGFLVPLSYFDWSPLSEVFLDFWETFARETAPRRMEEALKPRLLILVDNLFASESHCPQDGTLTPIMAKLDREREAWGEAWVPITCVYGKGWLTWPNSD